MCATPNRLYLGKMKKIQLTRIRRKGLLDRTSIRFSSTTALSDVQYVDIDRFDDMILIMIAGQWSLNRQLFDHGRIVAVSNAVHVVVIQTVVERSVPSRRQRHA